MQDYYAKGGFVFSHRNIRYQTDKPIQSLTDEAAGIIVPLANVPFDELNTYDRTCFPAPRQAFLQGWISQPDAIARGCLRGGLLTGYGVVRRCGDGCKVGPLFANDTAAALALYSELAGFAQGGPLFLDVPENNPAALELIRRHQMHEVFGCARMDLGPRPDLAHERVFGVTTFELG